MRAHSHAPAAISIMLILGLAGAAPAAAASRQDTPPAQDALQTGEKPASPQKPTYRIPRATSPIVVDGRLDEPIWKDALKLELPYEVNPGENLPAKVATEALLAYDDSHFHAAFRASDPDPNAIRARFTDRDTAFMDDFVGVVLDTFNDERRAFEFFVNPRGVQMDLVVDDVSGREDETWDTIWESAGSVTPDGYVVEMAIPYTSLRFQRGNSDQTWGLDLVRIYPRDRRFLFTLNPRDRNMACYLCKVSKIVGFDGAEPGKNIEITPTLTMIRSDARDFPEGRLEHGKTDPDLGATIKWGITPNLTASGAINPDFSQVEADVAQLGVNEQFALYYPEKRPFFLEGADFFETPLQAVYTRTVADPAWGAKLTGKAGKSAFGFFAAQDKITTLVFPGSQGSYSTFLAAETTAGVLRYRLDTGTNSTIGALATARGGGDYFNGVAGVDALVRATKADTIRVQVLGSMTRYPDAIVLNYSQPEGTLSDTALKFDYTRNTRNWNNHVGYLDIGENFRADLGFVTQVGIRRAHLCGGHNWYGDPNDWLSQSGLGGAWTQTTGQDGDLIDRTISGWNYYEGPMQSSFMIEGGHRQRGYKEERFDQGFANLVFAFQPLAQLRFTVESGVGKQIDYDFEDPGDDGAARQGDQIQLAPSLRLEPGKHIRLTLSQEYRRLALDGDDLFRAGLTQMRLAYQLNLRTFFRAIVQYENVARNLDLYPACTPVPPRPTPIISEPFPDCGLKPHTRGLFTQLLFSYKINPQTALYVGYTDTQQGVADPTLWIEDANMSRAGRTFFFKIGRAWVL